MVLQIIKLKYDLRVVHIISSLKQAVGATLNYFDILNFPPTSEELEKYLYGWSAPKETIEKTILEMPEITSAHGFYCLGNRPQIAEKRKENACFAEKLWKKTKRFSWLIAICPFVKMAAVCNSLSYNNVKEKSDIDLFIVTKNNRLYIGRLFLKMLTQIFGMRAHHNKTAGRFCLSFFVAEQSMNLEPLAHEFDPHLAYFTRMLKPLFGKEIYFKFIEKNDQWTSAYFKKPFTPENPMLKPNIFARIFRTLLEILLFPFSGLLENLAAKYQLARDTERKKLLPEKSGVVLKKDIFKFHENDPRKNIADKFLMKLESF